MRLPYRRCWGAEIQAPLKIQNIARQLVGKVARKQHYHEWRNISGLLDLELIIELEIKSKELVIAVTCPHGWPMALSPLGLCIGQSSILSACRRTTMMDSITSTSLCSS